MLQAILRLFRKAPSDPVEVRYRRYRNRCDISATPMVALMDAPIESTRQILPFLARYDEMAPRSVDRGAALAYNGDLADEIHEFENVTTNGSQITRLLVRRGQIVEATLKY